MMSPRFLIALFCCVAQPALAVTTLTFDEPALSDAGELLGSAASPNPYADFSFAAVATSSCDAGGQGTGYCFGVQPAPGSPELFNKVAHWVNVLDPATAEIAWASPATPSFLFVGADFSTFNGGPITVRGIGYLGVRTLTFDTTKFGPEPPADPMTPRYVAFNWDGLTRLEISTTLTPVPGGSGELVSKSPWILDNFQYQASLVPEPSTWALLACGIVMVGALVRSDRAEHNRSS